MPSSTGRLNVEQTALGGHLALGGAPHDFHQSREIAELSILVRGADEPKEHLRGTARRFRTSQPDQSWQQRAWSYYDSTPEVRFAATWIGNAMGKGRLFAAPVTGTARSSRCPT